ncbi:TPA_asm: maturation protein [ssRNA phage Gerhypos.1_49]|uniref:Maturation protein n=2 Tax=Fiersviridae TaxID=2842319 RepID=A0A8S5KY68_9VIRU|nr:maturation protein [ssRNA phage Gerhypos.1_49]QDH88244.1 MAG: hypothetical protein H1Bulk30345_000001 [Leviviridae sp.]QDH89599.1 MAG: hypothetical protein H3RhizoLitter15392_000001 [Leviviridae sp.]DAD50123.1 TPA_asm: maturation protein [ssRNA phage Gerhypos.1_49]
MPTEDRSYTVPGQRVQTQVSAGGTTVTTSVAQAASGSLHRTSLKTPDFALRKRTGTLPQNYFLLSEQNTGHLEGFSKLETFHVITGARQSTTVVTGCLGAFSTNGSPWSGTAKAAIQANLFGQAVAKAQSKIKDASIDLSVVAGEIRETRAMFIDVASRLKLSIDAARRKDARAISRHLSLSGTADFANLWLMINYGIRPFINDLSGACTALEKGVMKERFNLVRGRERYDDILIRPSPYHKGGIETWTLRAECGVRVKYAVTNPYLATLASLGLTNPWSTGWELAKLSFVVDWAVGIGGWLSQLDYWLGKTFQNGSYTHFIKEKCILEAAYVTKDVFLNGGSVDTGRSQAYRDFIVCERTAFASWPISYLPVLKDPRSVSHVATAASLLRQTWGR